MDEVIEYIPIKIMYYLNVNGYLVWCPMCGHPLEWKEEVQGGVCENYECENYWQLGSGLVFRPKWRRWKRDNITSLTAYEVIDKIAEEAFQERLI